MTPHTLSSNPCRMHPLTRLGHTYQGSRDRTQYQARFQTSSIRTHCGLTLPSPLPRPHKVFKLDTTPVATAYALWRLLAPPSRTAWTSHVADLEHAYCIVLQATRVGHLGLGVPRGHPLALLCVCACLLGRIVLVVLAPATEPVVPRVGRAADDQASVGAGVADDHGRHGRRARPQPPWRRLCWPGQAAVHLQEKTLAHLQR